MVAATVTPLLGLLGETVHLVDPGIQVGGGYSHLGPGMERLAGE